MQSNSPNPADPSAKQTKGLLVNSSMFYFILGCVGALICHYQYDTLRDILALPSNWEEFAYLTGLGFLGAGVLIVMGYLFEDYFVTFRSLRHLLMRFMGQLSLVSAVYLALLSSVAEEILFRGAIQPSAGLVFTALLFGLLHLGPSSGLSAWSLWAFLAGILLGWLYDETQSLWPSMIAHAVVNTYSMIRFRMEYRKLLKEKANQGQESQPLTGVKRNQ